MRRARTHPKAVYIYIFPGFADWEPAHALAELRRHGGWRVETLAQTVDPVPSMGGLSVVPSRLVSEVDVGDMAALILPGGDSWEQEPLNPDLVQLLKQVHNRRVLLAAICAATVAVTKAGLLQGRRHTSNGLEYLQAQVPGYSEAAQYVNQPAVRDRGLITASGLADVEFARELFVELGLFSASDLELWTRYFRSGRIPDESTDA